MKIIVNRQALLDALALLASVVIKHSRKPVLACVKLSTDPHALHLTGTDLEVAMSIIVGQVQIEQQGEVLINLAELTGTLKASAADVVSLESDLDSVRLADDDSILTLPTENTADYPPVPVCDRSAQEVFVSSTVLIESIDRVAWSAEPVSTGRLACEYLCFSFVGGKAEIVSTNTHTLALAPLQIGASARAGEAGAVGVGAGAGDYLIHVRTAPILKKIAKYVGVGADHFAIDFYPNEHGGVARLMSGFVTLWVQMPDPEQRRFPDYREIVSGVESVFQFSGSSDSFVAAVKKAALPLRFADQQQMGLVLELTPRRGVRLSVQAAGRSAQVNYPCRTEGEAIRFGVNPSFLIDAIQASSAEEFTLCGSAANRAWMVKTDNGYKALIMPVTVADEKPAAIPQTAAA